MLPVTMITDASFEKSLLFDTTSDEDDFYIKIVDLDDIYNFLVLSFLI